MTITKNQLKAGRALAGLGIRSLAEMTGHSPTSISLIETGKTRRPRAETLETLERVLTEQGVQFHRGGWARHRDDQNDNVTPDVVDIATSLLMLAQGLEVKGSANERCGARILRMLADVSVRSQWDAMLEALQLGLIVQAGLGMLVTSQVGEAKLSDARRLDVALNTDSNPFSLRALTALGIGRNFMK